MGITKVELLPIRPKEGLMAFACIELDYQFYISSIGVHRKRDGSGYRITYPTKKVGEQTLTVCHPIQPDLSREIEQAVCKKAEELFDQ